MGITIHYQGKGKSRNAIDILTNELAAMAYDFGWKYDVVEEAMIGKFMPAWGMGYGFIPSKEQIKNDNIEFFSKMVSKESNGYFKIYESKYAERVRKAFLEGKMPEFEIDTVQKGLWVQVHSKCEPLKFIFDTKTLDLVDYNRSPDDSNLIYGFEGSYCKTQFAGFHSHVTVCKLIRWSHKYVLFSQIKDEAQYYETQDFEYSYNIYTGMEKELKRVGSELKDIVSKLGLTVKIGDEN